jgi:large subunit ribosomal protein L9
MKVVLLERVENLGAIGDVVTVKDGFARNFLLPREKALRATSKNMEKFELDRVAIEARNDKNKEASQKVADKIDGQSYVMIRQAGETGQLYGSVAGRDVSEAIQAEGGKVERSQIVLNTPIKTLGVHEVLVRLHAEVSATVKINIARSADEAERQAKGEDVIKAAYDEDREAALEQAKDMVAGGAGQQDGLGSEA